MAAHFNGGIVMGLKIGPDAVQPKKAQDPATRFAETIGQKAKEADTNGRVRYATREPSQAPIGNEHRGEVPFGEGGAAKHGPIDWRTTYEQYVDMVQSNYGNIHRAPFGGDASAREAFERGLFARAGMDPELSKPSPDRTLPVLIVRDGYIYVTVYHFDRDENGGVTPGGASEWIIRRTFTNLQFRAPDEERYWPGLQDHD
jgi:hypothetical protein